MSITYDQFVKALEFLVAIEPDPDSYDSDMDKYDLIMEPHESEIEQAHATIKAYGEQIAPQGLDFMRSVLQQILLQQTELKSESIIRSKVNWQWDGIGRWLG
ncbi:MAG TPA: hypothetical protein DEB15_17505 [Pusillimonas sp.]|jgi:antitoxin component HigA of HigAB toxin-antitoxin module|nr:hypothetical protein [Pusillimonas sp.]|tara:strand:- start:10820 stop:11125 length:306 start_codon:yes stop_codon:yes gene_type:complete